MGGINKKCANCANNCKQFAQVMVCKCPKYIKAIPIVSITHIGRGGANGQTY